MPFTHYISLILYQTYANLRTEAVRTYISVFWWVLEPVLYMITFYLVFGIIFQRGGEGYVAFLLCGLVVWKWFDSTVRNSCHIIASYASLMQQVYLPKFIFPMVLLLVNTSKAMLILLLFLIFLLFYGQEPTQSWLALPIVIIVQFLFIAAVTGLLSCMAPFLPDMQLIVSNIMTLLFFLSGILFDLSSIPERYAFYFRLNPMMTLIDCYRQVLLEGQWPDWGSLFVILIASLFGLTIAVTLFRKFDHTYPKIVSR